MTKFGTPRLALLMSAVALVLAACTNGSDNQIAGPASKAISAPTVSHDFGVADAALIQVCIDVTAPAGPYTASFTTPTNYVNVTPEDVTNDGTKNDILQPTPQTGINPGECRLLFTKIHAIWLGAPGFQSSFTTITVTNTTLSGGTFSYICFPDAKRQDFCSGSPIVGDPNFRTSGTGAVATNGANPEHGSTVTFSYTPPIPTACTLGYPDNSNLPKSGRLFNESAVLRAYAFNNASQEVRAWYSDEHALLLGVRQVYLKIPPSPASDVFVNHPIAVMSGNPSSSIGSPLILVGELAFTGDGGAGDDYGRPLWPGVFVTDITSNPSARTGDWQQGGTAFRPNKIFGTWKSAVATVNYTKAPYLTTIKTDNDPTKNNTNLGAGANAFPAGASSEGYTTEIVWSAASLGLNPTHNYRLQFMVHDGDQNNTGGDTGQACMNIGPNVADRLVVN